MSVNRILLVIISSASLCYSAVGFSQETSQPAKEVIAILGTGDMGTLLVLASLNWVTKLSMVPGTRKAKE